MDAQIRAAAEYQRSLRRRRRMHYIWLIGSITLSVLLVISFLAWYLFGGQTHNRSSESYHFARPSNHSLYNRSDNSLLWERWKWYHHRRAHKPHHSPKSAVESAIIPDKRHTAQVKAISHINLKAHDQESQSVAGATRTAYIVKKKISQW